MSLHRLISISIAAPSTDAVRAFYRDFGLVETTPGRFATADGGEQLCIEPGPRRALLALAIGVDDADDLARAEAALARLGVAVEHGTRAIEAVEPATGVRVRLEIGPRLQQKPPSELALNAPGRADRVNARSRGAQSDVPARPRKLSHVVVGSPDAPASLRFFVEGVGFRVSDAMPGGLASFLRCSTDHHNLLVQPAPVPLLHHTSWQVDDVDEIGRGARALLDVDAGRNVWGLGRHYIGSNYFWYLRDPAGNFAECYSDLDVIVDDELWKPGTFDDMRGLYAWGPDVPAEFLLAHDVAELVACR